MPLTFESQVIDKVVVIRCKGRIALGPEVSELEAEVDRHTRIDGSSTFRIKLVVLQLEETDFVDSSGLGTLVRLFGILRAAGGGLKICQLSPRVLKVLQMTNLLAVFPAYTSEAQAIEAFSSAPRSPNEKPDLSKIRIVCLDTSKDLLAGLTALLTRSGYEVMSTRYIGEAVTLVKVTRPKVVICGPGIAVVPGSAAVIENLKSGGKLDVITLPSDFYTAEAGQAGQDLVAQVQSLTAI
ncbi:MAG TPA: STAS domain-containing protein [Bryobacteraceae bacterium]|nr:STAS domain-containing protein [Bryobacteraceae bacterium]